MAILLDWNTRLKPYLVSVLTVLTLFAGGRANAQIKNLEQPNQEDFNVVANYFSTLVREVHRPFKLYHWRSNPSLVQSEDVQRNPSKYGQQIVKQEAPGFISGLYVENRTHGAIYGGGLYAAVDPVTTESYGGNAPDRWALLVLHIPKNFQILDLRDEMNSANMATDRLQQAFYKFDCSMSPFNTTSIDQLFESSILSTKCAHMISEVLTKLKIDGFLYSYMHTAFQACALDSVRNAALVFTSKNWLDLPGADAKIYTARTRVEPEERRNIESQFFYTFTEGTIADKMNPPDSNLINRFLRLKFPRQFSKSHMMSTSSSCDSNGCKIHVDLQSEEGGIHMYVSHADVKEFYFESYPEQFSLSPTSAIESLHWPDLLHTATSPDLENWIKSNLLDCASRSGELKYPNSQN